MDGITEPVNRVLIQKDRQKQLVLYWFKQRDRMLSNEYLVKLYLFWDAMTRQRSDGALIRLSLPSTQAKVNNKSNIDYCNLPEVFNLNSIGIFRTNHDQRGLFQLHHLPVHLHGVDPAAAVERGALELHGPSRRAKGPCESDSADRRHRIWLRGTPLHFFWVPQDPIITPVLVSALDHSRIRHLGRPCQPELQNQTRRTITGRLRGCRHWPYPLRADPVFLRRRSAALADAARDRSVSGRGPRTPSTSPTASTVWPEVWPS
jgi:hypothetical protein